MTWEEYEETVFELCKIHYIDAIVSKNVKIVGRYSKVSRQIDILIEQTIAGNKTKIVVDCKLFNKKVDVKCVESFISMVDDIDAEKGLLITEMGYTKSALKRAYYNPKHIELDVLSLKELKSDLHGEIAIPYSGENGILIFAPLGWIVDAHKRQGAICLLYQRGLTLEEAGINKELAYINFWNKSISDFDLQGLLNHQENYMRKERNVKSINYQKSIERDDSETIIRVADIENYPGLEVTGFIEFKDFIVFIVWFCVETSLKRTISKMQLLIKSILPVKIKFE